MKRLALLFLILLCASIAQAQIRSLSARRLSSGTAVPTRPCAPGPVYTDFYLRTATDVLYFCSATNTWSVFSTAGADGTVTSVSGTANQINSTGGATPVLSLSSTLVAPGTITATTSVASPFYVSTAANPADAGAVRLGNTELIGWEAATPGTDLTLGVDASDVLVSGATAQIPRLGLGITPDATNLLKLNSTAPVIELSDSDSVTKSYIGMTDVLVGMGNNRNPTTGTIFSSGRATSQFLLNAAPSDSYFAVYTTPTNNTAPTERVRITAIGLTNLFKGADVASATAIVPTGNVFHVTGTTTITSITSTGIIAGTTITIIFDGILTFTNGSNLVIGSNFSTTANDTITLAYDGTSWFQLSRSVN